MKYKEKSLKCNQKKNDKDLERNKDLDEHGLLIRIYGDKKTGEYRKV